MKHLIKWVVGFCKDCCRENKFDESGYCQGCGRHADNVLIPEDKIDFYTESEEEL